MFDADLFALSRCRADMQLEIKLTRNLSQDLCLLRSEISESRLRIADEIMKSRQLHEKSEKLRGK
jgi:hypothetical protein